jgi:hypothetical protein
MFSQERLCPLRHEPDRLAFLSITTSGDHVTLVSGTFLLELRLGSHLSGTLYAVRRPEDGSEQLWKGHSRLYEGSSRPQSFLYNIANLSGKLHVTGHIVSSICGFSQVAFQKSYQQPPSVPKRLTALTSGKCHTLSIQKPRSSAARRRLEYIIRALYQVQANVKFHDSSWGVQTAAHSNGF